MIKFTSLQMRHRDIAYFTREQIQRGRKGEEVIPAFVIEVISESDQSYRVEEKQSYRVEEKIVEYFKAGVEVVWNIYPEQEVVYVYTSRRENLYRKRYLFSQACSSRI